MSELEVVLKERGAEYGPFILHAQIAQEFKVFVREYPSWVGMKYDQQEALDMILHKIARIINGNPDNIDSWVDIAGYSTLVANRLRDEQRISEDDQERKR